MRTTERNRQQVSLVLTAATVLLGASAFAKVAGFYVQREYMKDVLTVAQTERDPNRVKQCLGDAKKTADTLKEKNLFVKAPPKQNPVKQVEGILGQEAFIAGKWYKAGAKIGDAKIVAINATNVTIEWDGKETRFAPIGAATAGPPAAPPVAAEAKKEAGPKPAKPPEAKVVKAEAPAPVEEDPLAWMGVKLSDKLRAKILEKWNNASPEEREKGKEEWNKMSDEQKQQAVQALERM